ncbi:four-carbon acid sugar kinase family protein [Burkholderia pseudomallei]|uniref:four-carbon acid sugar kinase family protein n=1 Tax=Burkholderia pseudomallei TaxID=28450 RepID=UPI000A1A11FC|nr:four-carbon acid sugar kinase family protein [Burkholderia pseudomallei]ARL88694.1 hypothetical protein BOC57_21140 [Burkholderia pseudomallei]ARL93151.1 hypothetical protein BOC58_09260 [Burkholderia pseudomallei]
MGTNTQLTFGILADDLTSAADGAGPFVMRGLSAAIGRGKLPCQDANVVAVDSGSRSVSEMAAAQRVSKLTAQLASRDILYKTVDSTLRGHIAAELEASFRASGRKMLVFAPAFPAAGRTTVGGIQLVNGVPVSDTTYGHDPVHPARCSRLVDLLPHAIGSAVVIDASTQEELDAHVAAMPDPQSILWVGSPGIALSLSKCFTSSAALPVSIPKTPGEILVVIGSANPLSHRQAAGIANESGIILLRAPSVREEDPRSILHRITGDAVQKLHRTNFSAVIATGGDTMEAIMDRLDIQEFEILEELEPGFPLGRAAFSSGREFLIAMKAGGFGDDDTLRRAITRLRQSDSSSEQA